MWLTGGDATGLAPPGRLRVSPLPSTVMVTRRALIAGGLSAAAAATVAGGSVLRRRPPETVETVETVETMALDAPAPTTAAVTAASAPTAIREPATATTPADRVDTPLRVDWLGGSDIAWEAVSLPAAFLRRVPTFAGRLVDMRTRMGQAVMADGVRAFVDEAVAGRTDAIIMSINPVWLHWDEESCSDITVPHERYGCLLSPIDPALTERRRHELQSLIDTATGSGVPLYVYTQPHSTESLASPALDLPLTTAEAAIAAYDPGRPDVRFVARIFTRDLPSLHEGVEFLDMVHPTPAGAELLADWLAVDVSRFWSSIDFGG
jgi:hypothetical protein